MKIRNGNRRIFPKLLVRFDKTSELRIHKGKHHLQKETNFLTLVILAGKVST